MLAICYYGGGIDGLLAGLADKISQPIMFHSPLQDGH